jgi:hypothetical protein
MVASGVGLALSRFVWTTNAWLLAYALFWIWVIAVCIRLLMGRLRPLPQPSQSGKTTAS